MKVFAIIPARSGSKGVPNKNIRLLGGNHLIGYSIKFAKALGVDKVICSTDSEQYAEIAKSYGAEVPFLRSVEASGDKAMEQDILKDLQVKFVEFGLPIPDILVWLRPTFVFRDLQIIKQGIEALKQNSELSAARTICETEGRLYSLNTENILQAKFQDNGKSMIRRQDIGVTYKVYSTDIFRFQIDKPVSDAFLGNNILGLPVSKICGLDIDDEVDFKIVETILGSGIEEIQQYLIK